MELRLAGEVRKVARICTALSSTTRLRILVVLNRKAMTLNEVVNAVGNVRYKDSIYRHLEKLREAGLVAKSYDANSKLLYYSLNEDTVLISLKS